MYHLLLSHEGFTNTLLIWKGSVVLPKQRREEGRGGRGGRGGKGKGGEGWRGEHLRVTRMGSLAQSPELFAMEPVDQSFHYLEP